MKEFFFNSLWVSGSISAIAVSVFLVAMIHVIYKEVIKDMKNK